MPLDEVALHVGHTAASLRTALSHIPKLSYYTIRNAGLEILFNSNSDCGRALGFLADGDAFDILQRDSDERRRLAAERATLCREFMEKKK